MYMDGRLEWVGCVWKKVEMMDATDYKSSESMIRL